MPPQHEAMTPATVARAISRARHKRRRPAFAGVCSLLALCSVVKSVPTPTHQETQEPDIAALNDVYNDTDKVVSSPPVHMPQPQPHDDFMTWCTQVLGIQTSLEVKTFEYYDYMQISRLEEDDEFCDTDVTDIPMLEVRGLAATRDVQVGDVVISIPLYSLISIPTTIDHDPVLSGILGPTARQTYNWQDVYFESPLLTIAILYHLHLGTVSPLHNYMDILQDNVEEIDSMPLLWNRERLRQETTRGVRKLVREIQGDTREMYETMMRVLVEQHPDVFSSPDFSYERFQWAFAMVNSRHWYLPISDLGPPRTETEDSSTRTETEESEYGYNDQVLPASKPTEEWVREQEQETGESDQQQQQVMATGNDSHSFLAPVADLLNFGPPCTQGRYNTEKKAFEIVATCPFLAGQEVTFWYSDDCEDVIIANYGFTHPMVPRCPTVDEWREKSELWRLRAERLEKDLEESYKELGQMDVEVEMVRSLLRKCDCDEEPPEPEPRPAEENVSSDDEVPTKLRAWRQEVPPVEQGVHVRGSIHNGDGKHIRRKWKRIGSKSEIGL